MKRLAHRLLKPLMFVLFLSLLIWMVLQAGPMQLWHTLCSMPGTITLCILIWGIGYLFNAASFREVLYAIHPPLCTGLRYRDILQLTITGYAINYVTPFGLLGGEPYRVLALKNMMGTANATRSVVLYSTMHITSHFLFWGLAALTACLMFPSKESLGTGSSPVTSALTLAGVLSLFDWRLLPLASRYKALIFELLSRLVNVVEYQLIMQALGFGSFGYTEAFLCVAFSSLLANILFFSPMQMGTREGGIFFALQYLMPGLPEQELLPMALSLSFATRARELAWIGIGLLLMNLRKRTN